ALSSAEERKNPKRLALMLEAVSAVSTKIYASRFGAVAVSGTQIVGVGSQSDLVARFPEARVEDFGEALILPGLVNTHTHLELTVMRGYLEDEDFFGWLRKLTL